MDPVMKSATKTQVESAKRQKAKNSKSAVIKKASKRSTRGGDVYITRSRVKPVEVGKGSELRKMADEIESILR